MTTLLCIVVLKSPSVAASRPAARLPLRQAVFSERIRSALGEAWRALIG